LLRKGSGGGLPSEGRDAGLLPEGRDAGPQAWWHDDVFLFVRIGRGPAEVVVDW
jgi:hypothetical protein